MGKKKYYGYSSLSLFCGYLISLLSTRILSIDQRATLGIIIVGLSSLNQLSLLGIQNGIQKFWKNTNKKTKTRILLIQFISGILCILLAGAFLGNSLPVSFLSVGLIAAAGNLFYSLLSSCLIANHKEFLQINSKFVISSQLTSSALLVILLSAKYLEFLDLKSMIWLFLGYYLLTTSLSILRCILYSMSISKSTKNLASPCDNCTSLTAIYKYSILSFPSHVGLNDMIPFLPWLLILISKPDLIAAAFAFNIFLLAPKALMNIKLRRDFSELASRDISFEEVYYLTSRNIVSFSLILIGTALTFLFIGSYIVSIVFGASYLYASILPCGMLILGLAYSLKMYVTNIWRIVRNGSIHSLRLEVKCFIAHILPFAAIFIRSDIETLTVACIISGLFVFAILWDDINKNLYSHPLSLTNS